VPTLLFKPVRRPLYLVSLLTLWLSGCLRPLQTVVFTSRQDDYFTSLVSSPTAYCERSASKARPSLGAENPCHCTQSAGTVSLSTPLSRVTKIVVSVLPRPPLGAVVSRGWFPPLVGYLTTSRLSWIRCQTNNPLLFRLHDNPRNGLVVLYPILGKCRVLSHVVLKSTCVW